MRKRLRVLIPVGLVAVIGAIGWRLAAAGTHRSDAVLAVSGRIEGDESAVAPTIGGHIIDIRVREGDSVRTGDVIARLDNDEVRARAERRGWR